MATFISRPSPPAPVPVGAARVAVKDLIDVAGLPTTAGSRAVAATAAAATADAACMAGVRAAEQDGRAVVVGKTNLHELAFGVSGVNPWFGTPVNPLDPLLVPGGSSSGSAVAVATDEADVAFGTDTGGSIRIPAACCGVAGLKTTRGRVDLAGCRPLAPSLDTIGPMAATVTGVGLGMALLEPGFAWVGRSPARRIGRFHPPAQGWINGAVDGALGRFRQATGAEVVDVALPGWGAATHAFSLILSAEAWTANAELWRARSGELAPEVAQRIEAGSLLDPSEVAAAWERARAWADELGGVLAGVDLVALPVLAEGPPPLDRAARVSNIRYTGPFNLAGVPALALPVPAAPGAGSGPRPSLPASLQLVGPAWSEDLLLATARAIEATAP